MPAKNVEHDGLGVSIELANLKQSQVDGWYKALRDMAPGWRGFSDAERATYYVKAAILCKILPGEWTVERVDNCETPGLVRWLGAQIDIHIGSFITIPPNSKGP